MATPYQQNHVLVPGGEFIACTHRNRRSKPCRWINREEREYSRHSRTAHGCQLGLTQCLRISRSAAVALAGESAVRVAERKNANSYQEARSSIVPRDPLWRPTPHAWFINRDAAVAARQRRWAVAARRAARLAARAAAATTATPGGVVAPPAPPSPGPMRPRSGSAGRSGSPPRVLVRQRSGSF